MSGLRYLLILLIALVPMIPAVIFFLRKRKNELVRATKGLIVGLGSANVVIGLMALALGVVWFATPSRVSASGFEQTTAIDTYATLAAALSTGLAALGSGIAVASTGSAALGTISEKPELFGQALIFVGLSEGIAIYGLLISFLILNR